MGDSENEEIQSKFTEHFFRTARAEMVALNEQFDKYRINLRRKKFEGEEGEKAKGIGFCLSVIPNYSKFITSADSDA